MIDDFPWNSPTDLKQGIKNSIDVLGQITVKTLYFDVKHFIEAVIYRKATVDVMSKNNMPAWQTISKALVWKKKAPLMSWKWKHLAIIH